MAYYYSPFRKEYSENGTGACPFCDDALLKRQAVRTSEGTVIQNETYLWLVNYFPKFEGHTLIVPKRHFVSPADETPQETLDRTSLERFASGVLQRLYQGAGVEHFIQYGPGSAASIGHAHWHLTPALPDDPLRSFEKMGHFYTTKENEEKVLLFPIQIQKAKEELQEALSKIIGTQLPA